MRRAFERFRSHIIFKYTPAVRSQIWTLIARIYIFLLGELIVNLEDWLCTHRCGTARTKA